LVIHSKTGFFQYMKYQDQPEINMALQALYAPIAAQE
jgi:hypothetical protein